MEAYDGCYLSHFDKSNALHYNRRKGKDTNDDLIINVKMTLTYKTLNGWNK